MATSLRRNFIGPAERPSSYVDLTKIPQLNSSTQARLDFNFFTSQPPVLARDLQSLNINETTDRSRSPQGFSSNLNIFSSLTQTPALARDLQKLSLNERRDRSRSPHKDGESTDREMDSRRITLPMHLKKREREKFFGVVHVNNVEMVLHYLKKNPDLANDRDENGDSALHIVCSKGYAQLAKILVDYSADIDAKDSRFVTPRDRAVAANHVSIILILKLGTLKKDGGSTEQAQELLQKTARGYYDELCEYTNTSNIFSKKASRRHSFNFHHQRPGNLRNHKLVIVAKGNKQKVNRVPSFIGSVGVVKSLMEEYNYKCKEMELVVEILENKNLSPQSLRKSDTTQSL